MDGPARTAKLGSTSNLSGFARQLLSYYIFLIQTGLRVITVIL